MNEIKIVTLNSKTGLLNYSFDDAEETIISMNKNGYEYKGFVPTVLNGFGRLTEIKLVFEKRKGGAGLKSER